MRVVNLQTNEVHDVWKYLKSSDGQESVWCFDWYGHHVIGVDCEFEQTIAGNLYKRSVKPIHRFSVDG